MYQQSSPNIQWQKNTRYSKEPHKRDVFPARDAKCHQYNHQGHYSSQCLSKTIAEISSHLEEQEGDTEMIRGRRLRFCFCGCCLR